MRVVLSGASGLIGTRLARALRERGDTVTALQRGDGGDDAVQWQVTAEPAPLAALDGADAVVHLAGENIAQRWSESSRQAIRDSRIVGTANLIAGIAACERPPGTLISASAIGYYGDRGDELLDEDSDPGTGWLASLCVDWEQAALEARTHGLRVCLLRTGVVLDSHGGALAKMLPPFRLGIGGPVAGGRQFVSWIGAPDLVGLYLAALDDRRFDGPFNATAPSPVRNAELSRALGRALHRPAIAPVPAFALRVLYGDMAQIVTSSANVVPRRALALGHQFAAPDVDGALRDALR